MINEKEWEAVQLSVTRKDFYQIWNELLDVAKKLSERWDPSSTNESDPGIVLLKVLTACADRINYDIDKNILEAFMPSAAQAESMRKLCNMMGYNIKYYHSAETPVTISYVGEELADIAEGSSYIITIPQYTSIKNSDDTINYITKKELVLTASNGAGVANQISKTVDCIEGTLQQCESANGNIILVSMLDDNNRYYLPETEIAENGIFIQNVSTIDSTIAGEDWTICDNLNSIVSGQRFYKLGFDSRKSLPYIQFPDDIGNLIKDGVTIKYIRTNGANGNVSARTLSKIDTSSITTTYSDVTFDTTSFSVANISASTNGCDVESINDAYNNFKKTIGTFDTLVTCRDYMNKIYNLYDDTDQPYVSNIIVSDIRDDINNAYTLCSFNEYGICYTDKAIQVAKQVTGKDSGGVEHTITISENKIGNFDLVLYPFKNIYINTKQSEYDNSFRYSNANNTLIKDELHKYKTISHNYIEPSANDIICIKNYLKLNARITTTRKVNTLEETSILNNIYAEIYKNFNMRELDFGDEILYDSILMCIKDADTRIKNVSLDEPIIATKYLFGDNSEKYTSAVFRSPEDGRAAYNKLALRNILAAKVPLFNYNTDFVPSYRDCSYGGSFAAVYGADSDSANSIYSIEPTFAISNPNNIANLTLNDNEVISFRAPNFKTEVTYPAYVNYYISVTNGGSGSAAVAANFRSMEIFVHSETEAITTSKYKNISDNMMEVAERDYSYRYTKSSDGYYPTTSTAAGTYYKMKIDDSSFAKWESFIKTIIIYGYTMTGIYKKNAADARRPIGYLVDESKCKYTQIYTKLSGTVIADIYWVQNITSNTNNGLGKDSTQTNIEKNTEYEIKDSDVLYINYTESSDDDSGSDRVINITYNQNNPVIIRPNFNIVNSETAHAQGSSWTKTTGFDPDWNIPGMFTLGTNEQIEIRNKVSVKIDESITNLYWILKDNAKQFKFYSADGVTEVTTDGSYILQEGEYLFYTDANKLDIVSYGSGTEITRKGEKVFELNTDENTVTIDDILEYGAAAIDWVKFNFDTTVNYITICEYQYKNLLAKDTLCSFKFNDSVTDDDAASLNNEWKKIDRDHVSFKRYGETYSAVEGEKLPIINVAGAEWSARSKLNVNCGPTYTQTLHTAVNNIVGTVETKAVDSIKLNFKSASTVPLTPEILSGVYKPLSLKMNQLIQSSYDLIDTKVLKTGTDDEYINNFKVKLFEDKDVEISEPTLANRVIQLNNFSDNWTKVSFTQFGSTITNHADFNINVPADNYGLVMFYYISKEQTIENRAYITVQNGGTAADAEIFNYANLGDVCSSTNKWWNRLKDVANNKYYFRPGINIVKFASSCTFSLYPDASEHDIIIFSDVDIIKKGLTDEGLNLSTINYYGVDNHATEPRILTPAEQLLKDLGNRDPNADFYYNSILDNSSVITINTNAVKDSDKETLESPRIWYDYNNVNNKFVISEIDSKYLKTGIVIEKSSKM